MNSANESAALAEFERMVKAHDLTYGYSDDNRAWMRGSAERKAIMSAANLLPRDKVVEIWNRVVDMKLRKGFREQFYWKV